MGRIRASYGSSVTGWRLPVLRCIPGHLRFPNDLIAFVPKEQSQLVSIAWTRFACSQALRTGRIDPVTLQDIERERCSRCLGQKTTLP